MKLPSERVGFGIVLFAILIGNPLRVIIGEMQKPTPPEPTMTINSPRLGISITQTESQWKKIINSPEYAASLKKAAEEQKETARLEAELRVETQRWSDEQHKKLMQEIKNPVKLPSVEESIRIQQQQQPPTIVEVPEQTQAQRDFNDSQENCNGDAGCSAARD